MVQADTWLSRNSVNIRSTPTCQAGKQRSKVFLSLSVFKREFRGLFAGDG
jgi:hypothetical protein